MTSSSIATYSYCRGVAIIKSFSSSFGAQVRPEMAQRFSGKGAEVNSVPLAEGLMPLGAVRSIDRWGTLKYKLTV